MRKRKSKERVFQINCSNDCGEKVSVTAREYPEYDVICADCLNSYTDACRQVVDDNYDA